MSGKAVNTPQHTVNRIGDIFVGGLERTFNVVAGTIVFGHFVAILRGSDDGDIRERKCKERAEKEKRINTEIGRGIILD